MIFHTVGSSPCVHVIYVEIIFNFLLENNLWPFVMGHERKHWLLTFKMTVQLNQLPPLRQLRNYYEIDHIMCGWTFWKLLRIITYHHINDCCFFHHETSWWYLWSLCDTWFLSLLWSPLGCNHVTPWSHILHKVLLFFISVALLWWNDSGATQLLVE